MARILLNPDEKRAARAVLEHTWSAADLMQAALDKAAMPFGVNPREAYMTLLHLDTLDALRDLDFLVLKGGTCVQSYLPPGRQRISADLDFNSRHPHPSTVSASVQALNEKLRGEGRAVSIQGNEYGAFLPFAVDKHSGTVSYARYLYTPYDERAKIGDVEIQARVLRVQINLKHYELPAMDAEVRDVQFFTQPSLTPKHDVRADCASAHDLFADKILTITKDAGGFGREPIKDFYDLFALRRENVDLNRSGEKLDLIAAKANTTRVAILTGAIQRCDDVRGKYAEVKGFVTSACADGKKLLIEWETELEALQDVLRGMGAAS